MEVGAALVARHASALVVSETVRVVLVLAKLADGFMSRRRYLLEALCDFELLRIAEPNLGCPHSAIYVDPIISSCALERLARHWWAMLLKLSRTNLVRLHHCHYFAILKY